MALTIIVRVLTMIQSQDPTASIIKGESDITARNQRELPKDWIDFFNDWSDWEDPLLMFKKYYPTRQNESGTRSVVFRCNWDPHILIRKCELSIRETGMYGGLFKTFVYKENQVLHTNRNCILFEVPNNIERDSCASLLRKIMAPALAELMAKNPTK